MEKPTKAIRNLIYSIALERYHAQEYGDYRGMCYHLSRAYGVVFETKPADYSSLEKMFPEFLSKKPRHGFPAAYWWDPRDRESRVKAFLKMIEETK